MPTQLDSIKALFIVCYHSNLLVFYTKFYACMQIDKVGER